MKILFISMPSIHAIRWVHQLEGEGHGLYWFDILDRGEAAFPKEVTQITAWRKNKIRLKGKTFLKKNLPALYDKIQTKIEVTANEVLDQLLRENHFDIIHSFEMQHCTAPILPVLEKYPNLPWIYSCWGSDLFHFKEDPRQKEQLIEVLQRVNSVHTDCLRDFNIAKELGFTGEHFGVFPGGGGYHIDEFSEFILPFPERKTIILKGYQHDFGKALTVIDAFKQIPEQLSDLHLIIFSAHSEVVSEATQLNAIFKTVKVYDRNTKLSQPEMMQIMGKGLLYIGNSTSDGMPNTLLEAIIMGAFPIQSNPGNVTEEVIDDEHNGLLIAAPENTSYIAERIQKALKDRDMLRNAFTINQSRKERWEYDHIKQQVIETYDNILNK